MITAFSLLSGPLSHRLRAVFRIPGAVLDCESSVWGARVGASGGAGGGSMGVTRRDAVVCAMGAWMVSGSLVRESGVCVRLGFFPSMQ